MLIDDLKPHSHKMAASCQVPCLWFPVGLKLSHPAGVIECGLDGQAKEIATTQAQPQPCLRPGLAPSPPKPATDCFQGGTYRALCQGVPIRTTPSLGLG